MCSRLYSLRRNGYDAAAALLLDFECYDAELHDALGPYWPQKLLTAREEAHAS